MSRSQWLAVVLAALAVSVPRPATAQKGRAAEEARTRARKLYGQEDFVGCAIEWQRARSLKPSSEDLYRIGICYRDAKEAAAARRYLSACLDDRECSRDFANNARTALASLREPEPVLAPVPQVTAPVSVPVTATQSRESASPAGDRNRSSSFLVGAGVSAAIGGAAHALNYSSSPGGARKFEAAAAVVGYGTAAALVVAAIAVRAGERTDTAAISLSPVADLRGALLAKAWRF